LKSRRVGLLLRHADAERVAVAEAKDPNGPGPLHRGDLGRPETQPVGDDWPGDRERMLVGSHDPAQLVVDDMKCLGISVVQGRRDDPYQGDLDEDETDGKTDRRCNKIPKPVAHGRFIRFCCPPFNREHAPKDLHPRVQSDPRP